MATPGASLKFRRLRQRFGVNAPRLSIRTHIAWYWRALGAVVVLSLSLVLAAWIYDSGRRFAGFHSEESTRQIEGLQAQLAELGAEAVRLRVMAGAGESAVQIERTAQQQLSQQVQLLELENARLKQDLAFFEGMLSPSGAREEGAVSINRLQVEAAGTPGKYRYRLLVVNNLPRQAKPFSGTLQLLLKVRVDDQDVMIEHPRLGDPGSQSISLEVRNFQRVEGEFSVSAAAVLKDVEVRILQDGVVRARQSVNP